MPTRAERRHEMLVRYFRGDYYRIYDRAILRGPQDVMVVPIAYLALYAAGDMPYACLLPQEALQRHVAQRQVLDFDCPAPTARHRLLGRRDRSHVNSDELNWALATEKTELFDLPVIFVAWMRAVYGHRGQVSLWYPEVVPGGWALARFQQSVRKCRANER